MTAAETIREVEANRETLIKALIVGSRVDDPVSQGGGDENASAFTNAGALEPPYDPELLCRIVEHSNSLRQNVDAYATNIDGFGYRFEPAIDLASEDAERHVADAMMLEREAAREAGTLSTGMSTTPTNEEIASRLAETRQLARVEKARLETFFGFCCFDHSFVDLRRRTRQDLEVTGNAYWEVLRDGKGEI